MVTDNLMSAFAALASDESSSESDDDEEYADAVVAEQSLAAAAPAPAADPAPPTPSPPPRDPVRAVLSDDSLLGSLLCFAASDLQDLPALRATSPRWKRSLAASTLDLTVTKRRRAATAIQKV